MRVIELAGIGPAPFCGMMLADMGADVVRVDRPGGPAAGNPLEPHLDLFNRGRRSIVIDLKNADGVDTLLRLVDTADVLIEGFRPGVAERLGVGPEVCHRRNPRLVYGRMTGWGQDGPYAPLAGHDVNYIALAGALEPIGPAGGPPVVPLNIVGDYGGGGMLLAFGIACAYSEAQRSGHGQVVDAAIVDGAALLTTIVHALRAQGSWTDRRGANLLDGAAHFYGVYECADGRYVSVGAIEPQFYARLLEVLGLSDDPDFLAGHRDQRLWPHLRARLAELFATRTQQEWCDLLGDRDACFAPVLSVADAPLHPHNAARGTFVDLDGVVQPAPAPRFSRSRHGRLRPPPPAGQHTRQLLSEHGLQPAEIENLISCGAVGEPS
jgi:alpha-methylacyl-CoA racemase